MLGLHLGLHPKKIIIPSEIDKNLPKRVVMMTKYSKVRLEVSILMTNGPLVYRHNCIQNVPSHLDLTKMVTVL